jgi:type 2 lantibiotic biosynthesis protein LanM
MTDSRDEPLPTGAGGHARDAQHRQAGWTLAERLAALNLSPRRGRSDRAAKPERPIRWRAERRGDISRVQNASAAPIDAPSWLKDFRSAYAGAERSKSPGDLPPGFLLSVEPLVARARRAIDAALRGAASGICAASEDARMALIASFEFGLRDRLYDALSKTLVLELAVASRRNALSGDGPQGRFAFFCDCLAEPAFAAALLEQYPVLVRRVTVMTDNWRTSTLAFLSRLTASRPALRDIFFDGGDPGPLVAVETSGDTHCSGQSVHILTFADGRRLVYKPRSVAMEAAYSGVIAWLNRAGCEPDLKEVRTHDEGDFGWMAFVEAPACRAKEEVERFFFRQGGQIALAYVFGCADLHYENVVAHGEYPVLVDLEALFQTPLVPQDITGATARGWRALRTSVMSTSLLPEPSFMSGDEAWVDVSALGFREGQLTPFRVPVWRADGTDRMHLAHQRLPMGSGASLPEHDNARTNVESYKDRVVDGFRYMYRFLQERKTELLGEDGPLASCPGKPLRHVFRDTAFYVRLLDASHHPRFLTDAIVCEAFLHNRLRSERERSSWFVGIEDTEVASLLAGDIPYFTSRVGEPAVAVDGGAAIAIPGNGWEECRARVAALGDADLDRQIWLAHVAMTDLDAPSIVSAGGSAGPAAAPSPDDLIATATQIGERLADIAITDGDRATWLIPSFADAKRLFTTVAGFDLYDGLSGIALFLGHLGDITGKVAFTRLAVAAIDEALALYRAEDRGGPRHGAFEGSGGLAYALAQLADLVGRPEWLAEASRILHQAARRAGRSPQRDIISGQSGLIVAALAVHRRRPDDALIRRLRPLVQRLRKLAEAPPASGGLPVKADMGLAHGRAGIGFALARWAQTTGESDLAATAAQLFAFDQDAAGEASDAGKPHDMSRLGWCRGSLGIALGALQAEHMSGPGTPRDDGWVQRLADEIIGAGVEGPLCLCHGALGRWELLSTMARKGLLRDGGAVKAWEGRLFQRLQSGDWVADNAHALESPNLMVGLAGTGYALLRACHPQRVPSVLTLETSAR